MRCVLFNLTILLFLNPYLSKANSNSPLTIGAASSLKELLNSVIKDFLKVHPQIKVNVNSASSAMIYRQIKSGASIDLFISANKEYPDLLSKWSLHQFDLMSNQLVLVKPKNEDKKTITSKEFNIFNLAATGIRFIALCPKATPLGQYAFEFLEKTSQLQSLKGKIVYLDHARAVSQMIASGNAELGLIYNSDYKMLKEKLKKIDAIPTSFHSPIIYRAVLNKKSPNIPLALKFKEMLLSSQTQNRIKEYGFTLLDKKIIKTKI